MRDKAIGFLRQGISGEGRERDEQLFRDMAALIGCGLVRVTGMGEVIAADTGPNRKRGRRRPSSANSMSATGA